MRTLYSLLFPLIFSIHSFALNEVIYIWCGGVTPYSVNVNAKMTDTSSTIRLVLSTTPQFTSPSPVYSSYYSVDTTTNMMVAMSVSGLTPNTLYYYAVESGGVLDSSADDVGSFSTFPAGPCSFSYATGSCCLNSDHGVYKVIKDFNPLFYSCTGDLHYANPNSATNINVHRSPYETLVLSKPRAAALFKKIPFEYVWDDHDFSGNDSDSSFAGKTNARRAYREYVPHYPLPAGNGNAAIYQSFIVGRVHFIHTDMRSDRYGSSMLGAQQKAWFKNECILARNNHEIIAWMSSVTWNGSLPDNWGGFTAERQELSNFFRDNSIDNLFIICGDAHMLGIDDGSHGDFCTSVNNGALHPIFAAAALNQWGSYKGGTFSEGGYFPNPDMYTGQFGLVTVTDNGGNEICISFKGYRCDSSGTVVTLIDSFQFCRSLDPAGIHEFSEEATGPCIYPNPSDGIFTLDLPHAALAEVTDLAGRKICTATPFYQGSSASFDLRMLKEGFYFLRVYDGDYRFTKKIVIEK